MTSDSIPTRPAPRAGAMNPTPDDASSDDLQRTVFSNFDAVPDYSIAIIVPVYQTKREYLDECIESLRKQTIQNIRIILIDDNSPDECGSWCDEYALADARITVIHKTVNSGFMDFRNAGIEFLRSGNIPNAWIHTSGITENATSTVAERSRPDWVMFVDSDDWIPPQACETLLEEAQRVKSEYGVLPDMVIGMPYKEFRNKQISSGPLQMPIIWRTEQERELLQIHALSIAKSADRLPLSVSINSCWAKLYSYDFLCINDLQFKRLRYQEDAVFFQECVQAANVISLTPQHVYHYRVTSNSIVNSYKPHLPESLQKYFEELFDFANEHGKGADYLDAIYADAFIAIQLCITQSFFHGSNPDSRTAKNFACGEFLRNPPFRDVFQHLNLNDLTRNHRIKAKAIITRRFELVSIMQKYFNAIKGYRPY